MLHQLGRWEKFVFDIGSSCDLSDKRDLSILLSDWVWGRVSVRMWGEVFETCTFTNQIKSNQIRLCSPIFVHFTSFFFTESLYQKGSAKAIPEYFRIGENEVTGSVTCPPDGFFSGYPLITMQHHIFLGK